MTPHQEFEGRVAAAPDSVAVRYRERALSYRELNARANALARRLAAEGVGAGARVAVCLEPCLELPVALLAVLKAGAAYVPLDPTHPEARLRALLEEARPRALLARAGFFCKRAPGAAAGLALDDLDALTAGLSDADLELPVEPGQSASIFFTSGTTGAPKGVVACHANLAAYAAFARERYALSASDVVPALARSSFSISLFELLAPLTAGASVTVLDRDHVLDPERLARTLEGVTLFHAGPSLLKGLLPHLERRGDPKAFARVRHASSGGDMVPPEVLERLKRAFPRAEVFVIYGCTEISCMGCTYPVSRERPVARTFVGRPFDGVTVRVLDPDRHEAPVGSVGEIWFSGPGVVTGYLDRPELTAERFVEHDGKRFYRTGDLGRFNEDGWLEMLGRADFQIKVRGIRVELGEIEHRLRLAPGVRDAVVAPKALGGGEKALVAYVVMDRARRADEGAFSINAVREHLALHLPEYMLPAAYVELEALPLNHNMKLDRNALPTPEARARPACPRERPPRSPTEKALAALWARGLAVERVGLDDRFFDLGGNSLLGLELLSEIERELGVSVKGLELVRETLEGLAGLCDARLGRAPASVEARESDEPADFETFYFGEGARLYGVLEGASLIAAADAVLLCPPLGQDHARAHFVLRRLAARLAELGAPSLRFDYSGTGDSLGESADASCALWQCDIIEARRELSRRVPGARIAAVGARLGAALLAPLEDELELRSLIVWDPVCDGETYYAQARAAHKAFVGGWRRVFRPPAAPSAGVELLGLTLSEETVSELLGLKFPAGRRPLKWLATSALDEQRRLYRTLAEGRASSRLQALERDAAWTDVARLGDVLPDEGVSAALAALALERP